MTVIDVDTHWETGAFAPGEHPLEPWLDRLPLRKGESFLRGEKMFFFKGGPYDFACATCHGVDGQRIRLQDLPNFQKADNAQRAFTTWPAYRVSQGAMRTMQWRLLDCFRQQRMPEMEFLSQASIDLITYMGVKAKDGTMDAPAIKR